MTLTQIFIFAGLGLLAGRFYKFVSRNWLLFVSSVLAVFWLQPASPVRNLFFILPTFSLGLAAIVWAFTVPADYKRNRQDVWAAAVLASLVMLLSATRYFDPICCLTASRPPQIEITLLIVGVFAVAGLLVYRFGRGRAVLFNFGLLLIIAILIVLKSPALAEWASGAIRNFSGQDGALASPLDLGWLGFSYIAFRLIHVLRDRVVGCLPQVSLQDFVTYIVFFPALTAGPIERVERFAPQLQGEFHLEADRLFAAGRRLAIGLFMKFGLADGLAFFALNPTNAEQVDASGWMWLLLFAYAFRIFFDFAGYTHIAIGLGLLFGMVLPENFDRSYAKPNITAFWNSWHITLAQWFRSYYFNPLTRALRTRNLAPWLIVMLAQLSTMALIGLWHGITWNFLAWGLWHGVGLFVHNQWVQFTRTRPVFSGMPVQVSILVTFVYVSLGWVWFALPQPDNALRVLRTLFGIGA